MISLKRHLDGEHTASLLLRALKESYASTLKTVGASAVRACPATDAAFERHLGEIGQEVAAAETPATVEVAGAHVREALDQWADAAETDLRKKTTDVKELLVTLAHTAASVAASDAEHVMRFDALTARLRRIATLDDVTELRGAVLNSANELCASVEAMSTSTRAVVMAMQAELTTYQAKLEAAEKQAAHDPLTGLFNRRKVDAILERRVEAGSPFTVGLIDLDGFKAINDRLGHAAGDDLLRQFAHDLKSNVQSGDATGRWGGDEFIVVTVTAGGEAKSRFDRIRQWVGGRYTLEGPGGRTKVEVDLSIGTAEWRPGMTLAQLIDAADRAMYASKRRGR